MAHVDSDLTRADGRPYVAFHTNTLTEHPAQPTRTDWQMTALNAVDKTTVFVTEGAQKTTLETVLVPTPTTSSRVTAPARKAPEGLGPSNPLMWLILAGIVGVALFLLVVAALVRAVYRRREAIAHNIKRLAAQRQFREQQNMMLNSFTAPSTEFVHVPIEHRAGQTDHVTTPVELPGDLPGDRTTGPYVGRGRPHTNTI
ncbi:hypothetical protein CSOJ01_10426 [Colletotrichum sojae]|uniref:Transmembrane protein n=1 Tax=Colletotrichum sojae TaxID=2175907 RepID=A0A8H6J125_9PEZI|nr:hypothetical protein CSOJ01_10426 [Colletotrichum sojae]